MEPAPRIAPGGLAELGLVNWLVCRVLSRAAGTADGHLFSTLGRQRRLFRGWLRFAGRLMPGGTLPRHESELVILRVAHLRQCTYELEHHVRLGRRAGVDATILAQVFAGPDHPAWGGRHRALLSAVDALVQTGDLDDDRWRWLRVHYTEPELVELCLLVGHYTMLATVIAALRIAPDRPRA
jgi:AhpD family alkylhydroperoxidase